MATVTSQFPLPESTMRKLTTYLALALCALALAAKSEAQPPAPSITIANPAPGAKLQQTFTVSGTFANLPPNSKIVCEVIDLSVCPPVRSGPQTYAALDWQNGTYIGVLSSWPGANFGVGVFVEATGQPAACNLNISIVATPQPGPIPPYPAK